MARHPTSRAGLLEAITAGRTFSYRFFHGHTGARQRRPGDAVFSQWWSAPFDVAGVRYPTAEHWMMAGKARLFGDEETLSLILAAPTPAAAKALGRTVRNFSDDRWARARFDLVTEGNVHKFGSDPSLREHLLATCDQILVEASPTDTIWGIGLRASDAAAADPRSWRGSNLLGFALVEARSRLLTT
jgi:ribA/ribD-fused uncharacterized protein